MEREEERESLDEFFTVWGSPTSSSVKELARTTATGAISTMAILTSCCLVTTWRSVGCCTPPKHRGCAQEQSRPASRSTELLSGESNILGSWPGTARDTPFCPRDS